MIAHVNFQKIHPLSSPQLTYNACGWIMCCVQCLDVWLGISYDCYYSYFNQYIQFPESVRKDSDGKSVYSNIRFHQHLFNDKWVSSTNNNPWLVATYQELWSQACTSGEMLNITYCGNGNIKVFASPLGACMSPESTDWFVVTIQSIISIKSPLIGRVQPKLGL